MRAATVFNFLIEATLMGSVMIVLMLLVRWALRKQMGSRLVYFAWLLVAIRLLMPFSFQNPLMAELRPAWSDNFGVRPIADQVRVRLMDACGDVRNVLFAHGYQESPVIDALRTFSSQMDMGNVARWALLAYGIVAVAVLAFIMTRNARFLHKLKKGRIGPLDLEMADQYQALCKARGVKPIPVYWVDPLPSACVVGFVKPYIALPLTIGKDELMRVLAHEICHQKAHDPWWNVLRIACCVIHWFNPLVWIAARLSRTDCELACDERVSAPLSQEERVAYANTLALSVARKNAPEMTALATGMTMKGRHLKQRVSAIVNRQNVVKWLAIAAMCVAFAGTMFSFGTAEILTPLAMPVLAELQGEDARPVSIETQEVAETYARAFLTAVNPAAEQIELHYQTNADSYMDISSWTVQVGRDEYNDYLLKFDHNGRILMYTDEEYSEHFGGYGVERSNPSYVQDGKKAEVFENYLRSFARTMLPNIESPDPVFVDADYTLDGMRFLSARHGGYTDTGFVGGRFMLLIEPEVRVIGYGAMLQMD